MELNTEFVRASRLDLLRIVLRSFVDLLLRMRQLSDWLKSWLMLSNDIHY